VERVAFLKNKNARGILLLASGKSADSFPTFHCHRVWRVFNYPTMADFDDNAEEFEDANAPKPTPEEQEAAIEHMVAQLPPALFLSMQPLLMLSQLANHILMGYDDDPVPQELHELLGYQVAFVQEVAAVHDTPSLGRLLALRPLPLFDFLLISRLVFESPLDEPLRTYLRRTSPEEPDNAHLRDYVLEFTEPMLENLGQLLTDGNADLQEELRMRRLQTESIFARLADTLRPFYPPGESPADIAAAALDAADEEEDAAEMAASIRFNEVQLLTLTTALKLPTILSGLGETAFGRALVTVPRFRKKALERLADRLQAATAGEEVALAWSELLRLYQAAQVCALSVVADVFWAGSIEDVLLLGGPRNPDDGYEPEGPGIPVEEARNTREMLTAIMSGFIAVIEDNYDDDLDVRNAKAEISELAALLT
jgi:hypothetical protein